MSFAVVQRGRLAALGVSVRTAECHRQNIAEKLQLSRRAALVRLATAYVVGNADTTEMSPL